ncbi:MAG: hypothetical protein AAB616_01125 [Patescibacteria group bacterium]
MCFKCSQCDHAADQAGDCPTCNVPMNKEDAKETEAEGAEESVQKSSEASTDKPAE